MKFVVLGDRTINLNYVIQVIRDARGPGKHDLHMVKGLVIHLTEQDLADLEHALASFTARRGHAVQGKSVRAKS